MSHACPRRVARTAQVVCCFVGLAGYLFLANMVFAHYGWQTLLLSPTSTWFVILVLFLQLPYTWSRRIHRTKIEF